MTDEPKRIAAVQNWKDRMCKARASMPDGIGQQTVLLRVIKYAPKIDTLANLSRWRNAWLGRVSDPEITELVERAANEFNAEKAGKKHRLARQKMTPATN